MLNEWVILMRLVAPVVYNAESTLSAANPEHRITLTVYAPNVSYPVIPDSVVWFIPFLPHPSLPVHGSSPLSNFAL